MSDNRTDDSAGTQDGDPIATAAVLAEPVRRALYERVAGRDEPVDRDEAAAATGIGRPLAADPRRRRGLVPIHGLVPAGDVLVERTPHGFGENGGGRDRVAVLGPG